ncbi:MAG TPA: PRC-barrel domain-containing protein [Anaerolineales bacterium]|nr:PRC-barrel domain-containing protein [Anaerolineales bacterium]
MERTVLFQKNANVLNASGKQIGSLVRVVLHPETKIITDIVVQGGTLFRKEYRVVPVDLVAETTENQIVLHNEAEDLESFPPFEEERIVTDNDQFNSSEAPKVIYGVSGMVTTAVPNPEDQFTTRVEQNIPEGTVALKEGAKVLTADDKHVGNVDRILADPSDERATHLIITQGLLTKEKKLIPMQWVMMLGEESVHLEVKEAEINALDSTSPAE